MRIALATASSPARAARALLGDGRAGVVYTTAAPDEEHDEVRLRLLGGEP